MKNPKSLLQTLSVCSAVLGTAYVAAAAPATDTWTGTAGANWSSPGNWTGGNAPPQAGDSLIFGSSSTATLINDLSAGIAIDGITFSSGGSAFTLNNNSILLSATNTGPTGITNASGQIQTFGLNVNLDWGYYSIFSPLGGSVAFNGASTPLTANAGGVAYFDNNVTSSTMTPDGSGLISGLGGAGLIWNGTGPTGLATISGSSVQAYSAFTTVASGAVSSGNNIELTGNGAAVAYTDISATVNTITATQAGSTSVSTDTDTLTTTGTLTLGQNGGIYALSGVANAKGNLLSITGGTVTAGTTSGASLVLAANGNLQGNSPPNMMSVTSIIADNPGGSVTVVKTGTSSINYGGQSNTYSGGTYLLQGQLQVGTNGSLGSGPLYVAQGATAWLLGGGNYPNNIFISPGAGSTLWNGTAVNPGALILTSGTVSETLSGKITLLGSPVTAPTPGCRMTGDKDTTITYFLNGQITGTGTLDLNAGPHATVVTMQNQSASPNNWSGGTIIEQSLSSPSSARTILVNLGGAQTFTQIPHGAGAGDVTLYSGANSGSFITGSTVTLNLNGLNTTLNGLNGTFAAGGGLSANVVLANNNATTSCTLTVGDNNGSGTYTGVTSDASAHTLGLQKIGSGTETFAGVMNYHGNTTVSAGTLALSGACTINNTPTISVASGAILDGSTLNAGGLSVGAAQTLAGTGTVNGSTVVNGAITAFTGSIGTLNNNGSMTFSPGGIYVWDIDKANGAQGVDPGWGLLNISGSLQINSTTASPFVIDVTSLTTGDVAGNAANFSPSANGSWVIATATGGISGFSSPGQFSINTSAFSNDPSSSSQWSVSVVGNNLVLSFTSTPVITSPLVNQTNNAGSTATFTVVAGGGVTPITFNWLQGSTPLSNGGTSASGGAVTINTVGQTSTLSIANVQDADAGGITVNVTDHVGATGSSSATLTVVDPPSGANVVQSQSTPPASAGSVDFLTASANGTQPFAYQWYLGTNAILGATSSNLEVNVSSSSGASYSVVISNQAGSVTNTTVIGAVSVVPNQLLFEPFNYPVQVRPGSPGPTWDAFGVTNVYNQATGNGTAWVNAGTGDMDTLQNIMFDVNYVSADATNGDSYPWPGLAGNDPNNLYEDSDGQGDINLPLGTGGAVSSGTLYMSAVLELTQGGQLLGTGFSATGDYLCGFGTGANNSTTRNTGVFIQEPGNDTYSLGVFKTSGTTTALTPGVNGNWSPRVLHRSQIILVVARLNFNNSPATCDLWIDPPQSSFYASEANLPTPDVADAAGTAPDVGAVNFFYSKITSFPASRFYSDIRVGTTWASVTPPSGPTLSLSNVVLATGQTVAVFASQNAGNPAEAYQWQFNNGSPLADGPSGTGSFYSGTGTGTLTISNASAADVGTYTVTGVNSDPSNDRNVANGGTLTGTASATLTIAAPELSIVYSSPNVVITWPTNFTGYTLQETASLHPSSWSSGSLPAPVVVGTNNSVTVGASGTEFFRLKN